MSIVFDEVQFPFTVAYGGSGGPGFSTTLIRTNSGACQTIAHYSTGLHKFSMNSGPKNKTEFTQLLNFFYGRMGRARGFRVKDWTDYTLTNEVQDNTASGGSGDSSVVGTIGSISGDSAPITTTTGSYGYAAFTGSTTGAGGTVLIQLQKQYGDSSNSVARLIRKPVVGTVSLQKNGVDWPSAGNWSIDYTTGIITLNTAQPGASITASGQFDTPCQFDIDIFEPTIQSFQLYDWTSIKFVEVLV